MFVRTICLYFSESFINFFFNYNSMTKGKNFYKFATFTLLFIIVVVALGFVANLVLGSAYNQGVLDGRQESVSVVLSEISTKGYVNFDLGSNKTLTLVSSEAIEYAKGNMVNEIFKYISEEGYVQVNGPNNRSLILVPYQE